MTSLIVVVVVGLSANAGRAADDAPRRLDVAPRTVSLAGPFARQRLLVTEQQDGRFLDRSRQTTWTSLDPAVARVETDGVIFPVADGRTTIRGTCDGETLDVAVEVHGLADPRPVDFNRDVMPVFGRGGCNSGPCHGKQRGQNGFQLSLLGFDPQFDYDALTKEGRGRRVFPSVPEKSLLLAKPTGEQPHGGGVRLQKDGDGYRILSHWISGGMPPADLKLPQLTHITVLPADRVMANEAQQQLQVTAHYSDKSTRDVTHMADFLSNESAIASVDEQGLVTAGSIVGETAVMARYMGAIVVCNVAVPVAEHVPAEFYAKLPRQNFIDGHVWRQLERLRLTPSDPAPDHVFLRRVYIDIIGRVPTADEARAFLQDTSPDRRQRLIDALLERPEYADHWANKWVDLLRPNPYRVGIKATLNFDAWIRDAFRQNKPYDEFVSELVTARGSTFRNGAVTLFRDRRSPDELTTIVSQLFLGIRLECAKCHHHVFEKWGQEDFYGFAAYFAKIGRKGRGISPPISGSEEFIFASTKGTVKHPLTGEVLPPKPLFGTAPSPDATDDPRDALAAWMTSGDNPFFAQTMANRVWADLMGRGLVDPVDDLRDTNPPSNAPLLEALGNDFRDHDFDIKHLIRTITNSYVYALSSLPQGRNAVDSRNYSRHYRERLRAEVLLDAVVSVTEVPEDFDAMPPDSRPQEIWTHRVGSLFLDAFGRPDPNQDPPCERTTDTTVVQALHLMNAENLSRKITSDKGRAAKLAASKKTPNEIVEELYLLAYARLPGDEERQAAVRLIEEAKDNRRPAIEDLLWALMNTPEFVFKN